MKKVLIVSALALLAACSPPSSQTSIESASLSAIPSAPVKVDAPTGAYTNDKAHSSLVFRVSHMGFSNYTARFSKFDIVLNFDPANPAASTVEAKIDPTSLSLENPPAGFLDELRGDKFLDTKHFPAMTFKSTGVEMTGPDTARVSGDFAFHGATKPVVLEAKFNGGYPGSIYDPHARIGFSVRGALKRSDFGMTNGIPAPGSTMGVGDEVSFQIETELSGPKWTAPSTPPSATP